MKNISLNGAKIINDGTNSSTNLYLIDDQLYKFFYDNSFIIEKERNIDYLIRHTPIVPKPLRFAYSQDEIIGYTQEFIPRAKTFKEGIEDQNYDIKYKAVLDVFKSIKKIHECGFIIGDVHSRNFIYNESGGYLIDLDEMRIPKIDDWKFRDYYLVRRHNNSPEIRVESQYTDNVKATIASLSLLLGFDLEETARDESLDTLKIYIDWLINDDDTKAQIFELFDNPKQPFYLDDILEGNNKVLIK